MHFLNSALSALLFIKRTLLNLIQSLQAYGIVIHLFMLQLRRKLLHVGVRYLFGKLCGKF